MAEAGTDRSVISFVHSHHSKSQNSSIEHSLVQSNEPDAAGMLKERDTATFREENDASTVTVKLRGVVEDVVAPGAMMAASVIPGKINKLESFLKFEAYYQRRCGER